MVEAMWVCSKVWGYDGNEISLS